MARTKSTPRDVCEDPRIGKRVIKEPDLTKEKERIEVELEKFKNDKVKETIALKVTSGEKWEIKEIEEQVMEEVEDLRHDMIRKARDKALAKCLEDGKLEYEKRMEEERARRKEQDDEVQSVSSMEEEEDEESDSEEDTIEEDTNKEVAGTKKQPRPNKLDSMSLEEVVEAFKKCTFRGTTYPDLPSLKTLGIDKDYESLVQLCGLTKFLSMKEDTHAQATAEFLASVKYSEALGTYMYNAHGGGQLDFTISGTDYMITLLELEDLFGFPHGEPTYMKVSKEDRLSVWKFLSGGKTFKGGIKGNVRVRSPVVSYVRRAIAEVFHARVKTGPPSVGDIDLLTKGLKGLLKDNTICGKELIGDTKNGSLAFAFAKQLESYKTKLGINLSRKKPSKPSGNPICIGGPITSILRYKKVVGINFDRVFEKNEQQLLAKSMDLDYSRGQGLLTTLKYGPKLYYRFYNDNLDQVIELPNKELTSLDDLSNVEFNYSNMDSVIPFSSLVKEVTDSPRVERTSTFAPKKKTATTPKQKGKKVASSPSMSQDQYSALEIAVIKKLEEKIGELAGQEWLPDLVGQLGPVVTKDLLPLVVKTLTPILTDQITTSVVRRVNSAFIENMTPVLVEKLTPIITEKVETHLGKQMKASRLEAAKADKRPASTPTSAAPPQKVPRLQPATKGTGTSTPTAPMKKRDNTRAPPQKDT